MNFWIRMLLENTFWLDTVLTQFLLLFFGFGVFGVGRTQSKICCKEKWAKLDWDGSESMLISRYFRDFKNPIYEIDFVDMLQIWCGWWHFERLLFKPHIWIQHIVHRSKSSNFVFWIWLNVEFCIFYFVFWKWFEVEEGIWPHLGIKCRHCQAVARAYAVLTLPESISIVYVYMYLCIFVYSCI